MALPEVIDRYQKAHDRGDTPAALATFAVGATVVDDGRRFEGHDQIATWLTESASAFTFTRSLISAEATGPDTWMVTDRIEGNFPGGTVDLRHRFTLAADLITELQIAP